MYQFEADGEVDIPRFNADWEAQRKLGGIPPVAFAWVGCLARAYINSPIFGAAELRKSINTALGLQGRKLKEA